MIELEDLAEGIARAWCAQTTSEFAWTDVEMDLFVELAQRVADEVADTLLAE